MNKELQNSVHLKQTSLMVLNVFQYCRTIEKEEFLDLCPMHYTSLKQDLLKCKLLSTYHYDQKEPINTLCIYIIIPVAAYDSTAYLALEAFNVAFN